MVRREREKEERLGKENREDILKGRIRRRTGDKDEEREKE